MRYEKTENCVNIAIFASGEGTNTECIIQYFENFLDVNVSCVITNNEKAGVINRIRRYKINTYVRKILIKTSNQNINTSTIFIILF